MPWARPAFPDHDPCLLLSSTCGPQPPHWAIAPPFDSLRTLRASGYTPSRRSLPFRIYRLQRCAGCDAPVCAAVYRWTVCRASCGRGQGCAGGDCFRGAGGCCRSVAGGAARSGVCRVRSELDHCGRTGAMESRAAGTIAARVSHRSGCAAGGEFAPGEG